MATFVVIVLLAVAIAGIVVAVRQRMFADPATSSAEPTGPAQPPLAPNEVRFAALSYRVPDEADEKLQRIAKEAKAKTRTVVVTTLTESTSYRDAQMELAKKRADAIRRELEGAGVAVTSIQIRITQVRAGMVGEQRGDVFVLELQ